MVEQVVRDILEFVPVATGEETVTDHVNHLETDFLEASLTLEQRSPTDQYNHKPNLPRIFWYCPSIKKNSTKNRKPFCIFFK
jgi:hypothetical protein